MTNPKNQKIAELLGWTDVREMTVPTPCVGLTTLVGISPKHDALGRVPDFEAPEHLHLLMELAWKKRWTIELAQWGVKVRKHEATIFTKDDKMFRKKSKASLSAALIDAILEVKA